MNPYAEKVELSSIWSELFRMVSGWYSVVRIGEHVRNNQIQTEGACYQ